MTDFKVGDIVRVSVSTLWYCVPEQRINMYGTVWRIVEVKYGAGWPVSAVLKPLFVPLPIPDTATLNCTSLERVGGEVEEVTDE